MEKFCYCKPTKVIYGAGEFSKLGAEAAAWGRKALLVKDAGPLEELGIYRRARRYLEAEGITVLELEGITSTPRLTKIDEGIALAKDAHIELVIAVGGGSCIDTAKAIALGAADSGDVWDFFCGRRTPKAALPVGVATTIAGTGSETDDTAVVSYDRSEPHAKWDCFSFLNYPKFAILDPELHVTVPRSLTAAGMADAISHAAEAYFFDFSDEPFQDQYVEGLVRTIISCQDVLNRPDDLELRGRLCWCASLAIDGLGNLGRRAHPVSSWPGHLVLAGITAVSDTHHGKGMAVMLPACCETANEENPVKTARFAREVFGIQQAPGMTDRELGQLGIDRLRSLYKSWGLPTTLPELGVQRAQLPQILEAVRQHPGKGNMTAAQAENLLSKCF